MDASEYLKEYGFEKVTKENFVIPAEPMRHFLPNGALTGRTILNVPMDYWIQIIQEPELAPNVPKEVRTMFEVVKGCITYGLLFYPLFSLGASRLYQVCETTVKTKAQQEGGHADLHYGDALKFLKEKRFLDEEFEKRWMAIWRLRNSTSHPKMQMIIVPGNAISHLHRLAEDINGLFKRQPIILP